MIDAGNCSRAVEFARAVEKEWGGSLLREHPGQFFIANLAPGFEEMNYVSYTAHDGIDFEGELSDETHDLFMDIPDCVDPELAEHAAVVATYRRSDQQWTFRVFFGEESEHWTISPRSLRNLAEEVSPL